MRRWSSESARGVRSDTGASQLDVDLLESRQLLGRRVLLQILHERLEVIRLHVGGVEEHADLVGVASGLVDRCLLELLEDGLSGLVGVELPVRTTSR